MNILQAIILGIVQGLTEFLPLSSSGHLVLIQQIFGVECDVMFFDTMLHVGTLFSVVVVLWSEIVKILRKPFQKMTGMLIVATIPAVVVTLLFEDFITESFEGTFLGIGFLMTALVLTLSEFICEYGRRKNSPMTYLRAIGIGCMQALAIMPGLSRSGSTTAGALMSGVSREEAANFSFLMSIPIILGSVVFQGYGMMKEGIAFEQAMILPTVIGTVCAAISGFFAVKFMLNLIKKHRLYGFAVYTALLGIFVLLDQMVLHLVF